MRKKFVVAAAIGLLGACNRQEPAGEEQATSLGQARVTMPASVSGAKARAVMRERRDGMEKIGKTMKQLSRTMKSGAPDMGVVKSTAATISNLSKKASNWFPAGTGPDAGKTGAKAEIWQKPQDFGAKLKAFQFAASNFNGLAQGGNAAALAASLAELGKSCKACHDSYRGKRKD